MNTTNTATSSTTLNGKLIVNGAVQLYYLRMESYYLGNNIDFNDYKTTGIYGVYGSCTNSPQTTLGIAVLTVKQYTTDWVIQEIEVVSETVTKWRRVFRSGTTWSSWVSI